MNHQKLAKILVFASLFFLISFSIASAQKIEYLALPGIEAPAREVPDLLRYFYQVFLASGIILSFTLLIYSGFLYLVSFGNPKLILNAKQRMISCFLGLLLLFSSYVILSTIDPELVIWNIEILPIRLEKPVLVAPDIKPGPIIGLAHIPLQKTFEAIHRLEKQSLAIAREMNDLITKPNQIAPTAEQLTKEAERCRCRDFQSKCCPNTACPDCLAFCRPKQDNKGCLPIIRSRATKLANKPLLPALEKQILDLEEKIELLTKVQIEFDNYRRQVNYCRARITSKLLICAEAKDLGFLAECRELDFYCHYF